MRVATLTKQVFLFVCLTFVLQASGGKNDDEDSPYEFGFTIDGQQHRHEKKDVNGIIQGEFGFITADGIYHVTVYATDENGNFKILSMRNVRVSPPLDGSGTPEQKQQQLQPYKAAPSAAPPSSPPPPSQAPPSPPTPSAATTPKFNGFTTQPTIKPACASCGYVTTSATPKKFEFQSPAFNQQSAAGQASSSSFGSAGSNQQAQGPLSVNVPLEQNQASQGVQGQDVQASYQGGAGGIPVPPQYYSEQNQAPQYPQENQGQNQQPSQENQAPQYSQQENQPPQYPQNQNQNQIDSSSNPAAALDGPSARLSQVSVSDGAIHVPGNPDIPIQDKYPNMQDGLPNGIEEKDISDLLYKFNYTVGFHGHYEKGYKNGAKVGGYFVNGRDGISRVVTYVADENGYRPKVKLINLGLESEDTPKEGTEKSFGLKHFEFVWYPVN